MGWNVPKYRCLPLCIKPNRVFRMAYDWKKETVVAEESRWLVSHLRVNGQMVDTWTDISQRGFTSSALVQRLIPVQAMEVLQVPVTQCCPSGRIKALLIEKPWLPQNNCVPAEEVLLVTSICSVIFVYDDILPWIVSRASSDSEPVYF